MAEKKKTSAKKEVVKTDSKKVKNNSKKQSVKKDTSKKAEVKKNNAKKVDNKKSTKTIPVKKEVKKEIKEVKVDNYAPKKDKKQNKLSKWFNSLTLEQIVVACTLIIIILLIVLICVSTKNTKTKNGDDIVVSIKGKTITADDLYSSLKEQAGEKIAINMIDEYILDKEYKTTDEMKNSAKSTIENYKSTYGDSYQSFLEYNGIANDSELKQLLIKNNKLTSAVEDYIKNNLTDKEMKSYYENNIVGDIEAKHILIAVENDENSTDEEIEAKEKEAKKKAEEIIEKLKNGEDFSSLAKEYSDDEASKKDGGNLGYFNTGEMTEEFEKAAYKLSVNEYTKEPVKTNYGYHIILKTGEKEKPSYKKSKDTIIEKLVEQKKSEDSTISVKTMIALRKKYKMNIKDKTVKKDYESYIKEAVTTTTTTSSN